MPGQEDPDLIAPWDEHNQRLVANVHPLDWQNPTPVSRYNLVVIGAGTAGLVTAAGAAGLGAKVALIEKHLMGGDCLNVGCVPSKSLLRAAHAAHEARQAAQFGIFMPSASTVNFSQVTERMRRIRAGISPHDSARRFAELGVDVFIGAGRFTAADTIEVSDRKLRFVKAVIATGARAAVPAIPGLKDVSYLTNETVFSLTELPKRFGVIGAGPIGCELAQAFARFGSEVFLIEAEHGVLPREDREAAGLVRKAIVRDGVKLLCCGQNLKLAPAGKAIRMMVKSHGQGYDFVVDQLLVAAGRAPNVEALGLEKVGVRFDKKGVTVNDRLQTTHPRIYACGDICSPYQFTHAADFAARIVLQNALFMGRKRMSALTIPWCTYTHPEVAHVGLSESDGQKRGIEFDIYVQPLEENDRAVIDSETEGFVKILTRKGGDAILGATIVARQAGDLISEISVAMAAKVGLEPFGQCDPSVSNTGRSHPQMRRSLQ